jgi:hypothetical protein
MVPKRRSQVACGLAHSACDHWLLTLAINLAASFSALGCAKTGKEGSDEKFESNWG